MLIEYACCLMIGVFKPVITEKTAPGSNANVVYTALRAPLRIIIIDSRVVINIDQYSKYEGTKLINHMLKYTIMNVLALHLCVSKPNSSSNSTSYSFVYVLATSRNLHLVLSAGSSTSTGTSTSHIRLLVVGF